MSKRKSRSKSKQRPYTKGKNSRNWENKDEVQASEEQVTHKFNDPMWYAKNPQMLKDAASYSYNKAIGTGLFRNVNPPKLVQFDNQPYSVPGIMAFRIALCPSISKDKSSPLNIAANNVYSFVRYHNSGSSNYDAPDLMLYLMAMDSMYAMWNWGQRAYGLLRTYGQLNRYLPAGAVEASGFDFNDLQKNINDFRGYLNVAASKISAFCVPSNMAIFVRHSWMFSNIYKDASVQKSQMYVFSPDFFYRYDEVDKLGSLKPIAVKTKTTFAQFRAIMDELISAMQLSEDVGIMSGDIKKAYGDAGLFTLTPISEDYSVEPVYNEEVLTQIHNLSIMPRVGEMSDDWADFAVTQDPNTNALLWNPQFNEGVQSLPSTVQRIINLPWDNVEPANTMVATRLTVIGEYIESTKKIEIQACGTEVVTSSVIYQITASGEVGATSIAQNSFTIVPGTDPSTLAFNMCMLTDFDWCPIYYIFTAEDSAPGNVMTLKYIQGDLCNYTILNGNDLWKLHETAVLSEFNVPQLGTF